MIYKEINNIPELYAAVQECYSTKEECILGCVAKTDFSLVGTQPFTYHADKIADRNLINCSYNAGACIGYAGNVAICAVTQNKSDFVIKFAKAMKEFLISKGLDAMVMNNDVVYKDKYLGLHKVASGANCHNADHTMHSAPCHVSIHIDEEYVRSVCTKRGIKRPSSLDQFGITGEEVLDYLKEHLLNEVI